MILTRKNALGGRPISKFPIGVDPDTGYYGYKIGYCQSCNCALYLRTIDTQEIIEQFDYREKEVIGPREPLKHKLIRYLGGVVDKGVDKL